MKKAKLTLKFLLMGAVSLLLLTSILLSTMLGSVSAALVKSFSKSLDFEVKPDLIWKYYLHDKDAAESGVYKNSQNITQDFQFTGANGSGVRYHIAIPVNEPGYYTLSFGVEISSATSNTSFITDLNNPVGCKVISVDSTYSYGSNETFRISSPTQTPVSFKDQKYFSAADNYQWKTVAPSRKENVSLTFYANSTDVSNQYVLWMWDFYGLKNPITSSAVSYTINLTEISWEKDYSMQDQSGPYFDFANMTYKNMNIMPTSTSTLPMGTKTSGTAPTRRDENVVGHATAGLTRETAGRGTYVTHASANSMLMQVEPVYYAWRTSNETARYDDGKNYTLYGNHPWIGSEDEGIENYHNKAKNTYDYSNPIVLNVPVKNVEAGKTYRVVFDFSIAKQGTTTIENTMSTASPGAAFANYDTTLTNFFASDKGVNLHFQSYFYKSRVQGYGIETTHATEVRGYYSYANKFKNTHWLTSYNDLTFASNGSLSTAISTNIKSSVNDISWHNATTHVENNGENSIMWLTLENTSFTFNIQGYNSGNNVIGVKTSDLRNLQWVWAIDMFAPTAWYRFKIENVRFEEVVDYGANIGNSSQAGIKIGDYEVSNVKTSFNGSRAYRGSSGTGQNFLARGYSTSTAMPALQIYSPVYDLLDWDKSVPSTSQDFVQNRERIYLSGWCVVDGGVDKYVWSPDGGKTWHDMKIEGALGSDIESGSSSIALQATQKINPCMLGNSLGTNAATYATVNGNGKIDFNNKDDGLNADFRGYKIYADLSDYLYEHNLDIIFAAVPNTNPSLRCEILRIKNYNYTRNYRTYTNGILSDITTSDGQPLYAHYNASTDAGTDSTVKFTSFKSVNVSGGIASAGGYARRAGALEQYKDIRTLYTAIPVKTTLRLDGWAMVEGGIDKYMWSVDYGKTWNEFSADQAVLVNTNFDSNQRKNWYDGATAVEVSVKGDFTLYVPLEAYVGQVVDVMVAVKPNYSYALCPVSRVDNVAVYGENNSFYTKLNSATVGGSTLTPTYFDVNGNSLNLVSKNTTSGALAQWNIGYGAPDGQEFSYTMFEPYNVNVLNTRNYTNAVQTVMNGTTVSIDGYVVCSSGVAGYKYTLDGGNSWISITRSEQYAVNSEGKTNAQKSDSTFTENDCVNGNFSSSNGGANLEFSIKGDGLNGQVRTLLVVAESTTGNCYPVFSAGVKFAD